jgi:antirestriction protein
MEQQASQHETEASHERTSATSPQIYVASLSDYNDGRLHGSWIPADATVEELTADISTMLEQSPSPGAEEWAIHDYEGFGPVRLSEHEDLTTVTLIAQGITEHGPAFAHWADICGVGDADALAQFEDAFLGFWNSIGDYAEQLVDDLGITEDLHRQIPAHLQPYVSFDIESFARDLELSGDVVAANGDGGVYLFCGNA